MNIALQIATKEAQKANHRYRLGAVALKDGVVVAKGHNQYTEHAFLKRRYGYYSIHAEAITVLRSKYYKADTLVVVRILKDNSLTCSFPCKRCQKIAKDFKFKKIIYIDWDGNSQEIKL